MEIHTKSMEIKYGNRREKKYGKIKDMIFRVIENDRNSVTLNIQFWGGRA